MLKNAFTKLVEFLVSFKVLKKYDFLLMDIIYTSARRQLSQSSFWRYGQDRVALVMQEATAVLKEQTTFQGKNYLDLGCGKHNPFGNSVIMYINGASSCTAFDLEEPENDQRAAECIYDLLAACALNPDKWMLGDVTRDVFFDRLNSFDSDALKKGDLKKGFENVPIAFLQGNLEEPINTPTKFDIVTSRSVLEHFLKFDACMQNLHNICAKGAIHFHSVDLVDHRVYGKGKKYNYWSFLKEDQNWTDNHTNRLRNTELKERISKANYEVLYWKKQINEVPAGMRENFSEKYRVLSAEELSVTGVKCSFRTN